MRCFSVIRARLPEWQTHRLRHSVLVAHRFNPPAKPTINSGVLREACWEERIVRFDYTDKLGAATQRDAKPLSIMLYDQSHCLLVWCLKRDDYRVFRLDRMSVLHVTETSFRQGRVPLLKTYLANLAKAAEGRLVSFSLLRKSTQSR